MMAFTACVGFGLFLQSGIVINMAGPGVAVIAFALACTVLWAIVGCLGEMTALFPVPGPLFEFPGRFLDESVGYATGWLSWYEHETLLSSPGLTYKVRAHCYHGRAADDYLPSIQVQV